MPGGVGPLTIAMLMSNTVELARAASGVLKAGLTGGLASGKSFVGRALAELGCLLIQADELGHR